MRVGVVLEASHSGARLAGLVAINEGAGGCAHSVLGERILPALD